MWTGTCCTKSYFRKKAQRRLDALPDSTKYERSTCIKTFDPKTMQSYSAGASWRGPVLHVLLHVDSIL